MPARKPQVRWRIPRKSWLPSRAPKTAAYATLPAREGMYWIWPYSATEHVWTVQVEGSKGLLDMVATLGSDWMGKERRGEIGSVCWLGWALPFKQMQWRQGILISTCRPSTAV